MADKYQTLVSGRETMREGKVTSAGAADAGKIVALNAGGKIDPTMLDAQDVTSIVASEALGAGDYVNIWNDAGTRKIRKADSTNDRPAHGFVKSAVLSAAAGNVYFEGANDGVSGRTIGARQYLSASGGVQETAPVLPTDAIHQFLGIAISATEINTDIEDAIVL